MQVDTSIATVLEQAFHLEEDKEQLNQICLDIVDWAARQIMNITSVVLCSSGDTSIYKEEDAKKIFGLSNYHIVPITIQ